MALIMHKVMRLKELSYLRALFQPYVSLRPTRGVRQDLKVTRVAPTSFQVQGARLGTHFQLAFMIFRLYRLLGEKFESI